jgi:hypothetical protein
VNFNNEIKFIYFFMQNKIKLNKKKEIQRLRDIKLNPGTTKTEIHRDKTNQADHPNYPNTNSLIKGAT